MNILVIKNRKYGRMEEKAVMIYFSKICHFIHGHYYLCLSILIVKIQCLISSIHKIFTSCIIGHCHNAFHEVIIFFTLLLVLAKEDFIILAFHQEKFC
jgi:hypothetical protein